MKLAIIDFNRTIFDPETGGLIPGAQGALDALEQKKITLVLVSRREAGRNATLNELGISKYFAETVFVPEKTPELFEDIIRRYRTKPEETYVIGDYFPEEIHAGISIGAKTIRLKRGKFSDLSLRKGGEPWKTIKHLKEITELL